MSDNNSNATPQELETTLGDVRVVINFSPVIMVYFHEMSEPMLKADILKLAEEIKAFDALHNLK